MLELDYAQIKRELGATPKNFRTAVINGYAQKLGVSRFTIYRGLRNVYGPAKVIKKECSVDQKLIDEVAKLKTTGAGLSLDERELSTELCIEILHSKGIILEPDALKVSTVNRRLKQSGFRQKEKIVRVEAQYANQQHQLDFSRSKYFQLLKFDSYKNDYLLKVSGKTLFYKEDETKLRTWLIGITDAYSRVSLARLIPATGESALIGIEFLNFAYARNDDEHPLNYIPDILKTDNGSFIKDHSVKAMLEALEIQSELSEPFKHRGIQKREAAWKEIWRRFELKLALQIGDGKTIGMMDYNELLHDHMIKQLDAKHPVKNETRGHVYRASLSANPPRTIDVDLREVAFKVEYRTVGPDCMISLNTEKYEAPLFALGKRIKVYKNRLGEVVGDLIEEFHKPFTLKPTEGYVELGNFEHREKQTYVERIEAEVKQAKGKQVKEEAKQSVKVNYLPVRSKKQTINTKFNEVVNDEDYCFPTIYDAQVYIGSKLRKGETYRDYEAVFAPMLQEDLSKRNIDFVLEEINNGLTDLASEG
jgi:hypothetical protein